MMNETMWPETTTKKARGVREGKNTNLNNINKYAKPKLNEIGLECTPIVGEEEVRKIFSLAAYEVWSTFQNRFVKGGSGCLHKIFSIEDSSHYIVAQMFTLESSRLDALKSRVHWNIPHDIVESTEVPNRIKKTLEALEIMGVFLYVHVKPSSYILMKYSDIPVEGWNLFSHTDKRRLNRMYVRSKYLERCYLHYSKFEKDVKGKL